MLIIGLRVKNDPALHHPELRGGCRSGVDVDRGPVRQALSGSNGIAIAVVGSALLIGLGTIASGHIKMAKRIKTHITKVGLCGTVLGFILALSSIDPTQDTAARIAGVLTGMGLALYVTLSGLLANLWLIINLVLLGHDDG